MKYRKLALTILSCALMLGFQTSLMGQIFFTDSFDYDNGSLVEVSGGNWVTHSGPPGMGEDDIQVLDGNAVITAPQETDNSRDTGMVMGLNDIWYYAVRFSVEQGSGTVINNDYFIHFKDETTFGYNARLALAAPTDANKDFSLQIWASSGSDGMADWDGDFDFGEEIIAVVCWNNGTGDATLWVNPVDMNSTSITDNELADAMRNVEVLALRQDGAQGDNSSIVTVPIVSCGTDFDAVLAEVTPNGGGVVIPSSFTVTEGDFVSGALPDLEISDNMDLVIRRRSADLQSRTEFEVNSTSPTATPTVFEFTLEGNVFARGNVVQTIELFDFDAADWELVDTTDSNRSPMPDKVVTAMPGGDLSRFVEAGTNAIAARILYKSDRNRQKFSSSTDQAVWFIQ